MLVIPEELWQRMLDNLALHAPTVERVAFLDGFVLNDTSVVSTITVPCALCHPRYYTVPAASMSEAGAHLRKFGMRRVAQVHTHGDDSLWHSARDDEMAYSQAVGAISIVLPYHARFRPSPHEGLTHVKTSGGWLALSRSEAESKVIVVPSNLDFRRL